MIRRSWFNLALANGLIGAVCAIAAYFVDDWQMRAALLFSAASQALIVAYAVRKNITE